MTGGTGGVGGAGGAGGATCADQCVADFPDGVTDWDAMLSCLYCSACFDICDGGIGDVCESGSEDAAMCSVDAQSMDCDTCVNSDCSQANVCVSEVGTCGANADCIRFNDCFLACPAP